MINYTQGKPRLLLLWLVLKAFSLLMMCTILLWISGAFITVGVLVGAESMEIVGITLIIILNGLFIGKTSLLLIFFSRENIIFVFLGLSAYWWCVVRSYRKELIENLPSSEK